MYQNEGNNNALQESITNFNDAFVFLSFLCYCVVGEGPYETIMPFNTNVTVEAFGDALEQHGIITAARNANYKQRFAGKKVDWLGEWDELSPQANCLFQGTVYGTEDSCTEEAVLVLLSGLFLCDKQYAGQVMNQYEDAITDAGRENDCMLEEMEEELKELNEESGTPEFNFGQFPIGE